MTGNNAREKRVHDNLPTKALQSVIDSIQAKNTSVREEEVMEDVTQAVEEVRQERFIESFKQASAHKSS